MWLPKIKIKGEQEEQEDKCLSPCFFFPFPFNFYSYNFFLHLFWNSLVPDSRTEPVSTYFTVSVSSSSCHLVVNSASSTFAQPWLCTKCSCQHFCLGPRVTYPWSLCLLQKPEYISPCLSVSISISGWCTAPGSLSNKSKL